MRNPRLTAQPILALTVFITLSSSFQQRQPSQRLPKISGNYAGIAATTLMAMAYQDVSPFWALSALVIVYYLFSIISVRRTGFEAPLIGFKSIFEPPILART